MAVSALIAGGLAAGGTAYAASKSASAQKKASKQAAKAAEASRVQADREFNRANQKAPNIAAIMKRNRSQGASGVSGTYLTGSGGAPVSGGMLGRTTLLGG